MPYDDSYKVRQQDAGGSFDSNVDSLLTHDILAYELFAGDTLKKYGVMADPLKEEMEADPFKDMTLGQVHFVLFQERSKQNAMPSEERKRAEMQSDMAAQAQAGS